MPSTLKSGQSGEVKLYGTWDSTKLIEVSTEDNIKLINSIDSKEKDIAIEFKGISKIGDNTVPIEIIENIEIGDIQDTLFGTWSGNIDYSIKMLNKNDWFGAYDESGRKVATLEEIGIYDITVDDNLNSRFSNVTKLVLPDDIDKIEDNCFKESLYLKEVIIPEGVTEIVDSAFELSSIQQVSITSTVEKIGTNAFHGCMSLADVTIKVCKTIDKRAFQSCINLGKNKFT